MRYFDFREVIFKIIRLILYYYNLPRRVRNVYLYWKLYVKKITFHHLLYHVV
jgi:hypothetical protein